MKNDYYDNLRRKWIADKEKLGLTREMYDQERRTYYANYYLERNGDGQDREGYRARQNRTRAALRYGIDEELAGYRSGIDRNWRSWTQHYADLNASRNAGDDLRSNQYQQSKTDMYDSWSRYQLLVNEYNATYYAGKTASRTQTDTTRSQNYATDKNALYVFWNNHWANFKSNQYAYWQRNFVPAPAVEVDLAQYQLLEEEAEPIGPVAAFNQPVEQQAEPAPDYYVAVRASRNLSDNEVVQSRQERGQQIQQQRQADDTDFNEHAIWTKYQARVKPTREERDAVAYNLWWAYFFGFLSNIGRYWTETTQIRSSYNTRVSAQRKNDSKERTAAHTREDDLTAANRQTYRTQHTASIDTYYRERDASSVQRNADTSRSGARTNRRRDQRAEIESMVSYTSYMNPILAARVTGDADTVTARSNSRTARNTDWQADIEAQTAWVDNYYPDTRAARREKDQGKQGRRKTSDTELKNKHRSKYQDLDDYIESFFEVRNTTRANFVTERNLEWAGQQAARTAWYTNKLADFSRERDEYDQSWQGEYAREYVQYDTDISTLRRLGYNQYAWNKEFSRGAKKVWRGFTTSVLDKQRVGYDTLFAAGFYTYDYGYYAEQKIHTLASWSYHQFTGLAYYLNLTYRYVILPVMTGSFEIGVHVKRGGEDSAVYCYRYLLRDRLHDLAVIADYIYLPTSWVVSNFLLERGWNLEDGAVSFGRLIHDISARLAIMLYRAYVPTRQIFSIIITEFCYAIGDICGFSGRVLLDLGVLVYRAWMAFYMPLSELLSDLVVGVCRAGAWLARSFGNLVVDSINNLYALVSYAFLPIRFPLEILITAPLFAIYRAGILLGRAARDFGQLFYIGGYSAITPPSRLFYDMVRGLLHLMADALKYAARFTSDGIYKVGLLLQAMYSGLVIVCEALTNILYKAGSLLFRGLLRAATLLLTGIVHVLYYAVSAVHLCGIPLAIALTTFSRVTQHYTTMAWTGSIRTAHDIKHEIGKQLNYCGIPLMTAGNYLCIGGAHVASIAGRCIWRTGDDYVVYPIVFGVTRGLKLFTRGVWDAGVWSSRQAQDVCTAGIRKYHDLNNEFRQIIDPPAIVTGRSAYDCGASVSQTLEFGAKRACDMLNACSPLHLLERGGDQVLSEHAANALDIEAGLLPRTAQQAVRASTRPS
jgi:hypothetical protein